MIEPALAYPVLRALGEGRNQRTLVRIVLRAMAIMTGVVGLYFIFESYRRLANAKDLVKESTFDRLLSGESGRYDPTFVLVIICILLLVRLAVVIQVYWFRSTKADSLPESAFPTIPLFSQLFRCTGELLLTASIFDSLSISILIWAIPVPLLPDFLRNSFNPVVFGIAVLLIGLIIGFSILMICYLSADLLAATEDRTRSLRHIAFGNALASVAEAGVSEASCPSCQQPAIPGSAFCDNCGQRLLP
jgi:hypothetical protein